MALEGFNIRDQLDLLGPCSRTANAACKWDHQTAVPTLIRTNLQNLWLNHTVKAGPIEPIIGVMHFTRNGCHQRDLIGFTRRQRLNGFCQIGIGHSHGLNAFLSSLFEPWDSLTKPQKPVQSRL